MAAFGLLPVALSLTRLGDSAIWRLSSAAAALLFSAYFVALLRRRRRVTVGPLPLRTVIAAASVASTVAFWVNASRSASSRTRGPPRAHRT